MKRIFTLLLAVFAVVSLMGQNRASRHLTPQDFNQRNSKKLIEKVNPQAFIQDDKSALELKQALDSIYYVDGGIANERDIFTYDAHGNNTQFLNFMVDETMTMQPYSRSNYTFDGSGNMTSYSYAKWDYEANDYVFFFKVEMTYQNNLVVSGAMYTWDTESISWTQLSADEYTYNEQNQVVEVVTKAQSGDLWVNSYRETFSYNADGELYLTTDYNWDVMTSAWVAFNKDESSFDANGDVEVDLQSDWEVATSSWVDKYKDEYTYDSNHHMLTDVYSESYNAGISWDKFDKYEYTYDDMGEISSVITYEWGGGDWTIDAKAETVYDENYTISQLLVPNEYLDEYEFGHMLKEMDYFVWNKDWADDGKMLLYYSEVDVNGINPVTSKELQVYPNPSHGQFHVEISGLGQEFTMTVVDISGNIIQQEEVRNANSDSFVQDFDLSKLSSGVYFIRFFNDTKRIFRKIVIE